MTSLPRKNRLLLVDGYIREHEKILKLSSVIPRSINVIIFEFQLLIKKWNKKCSNPNVNIIDDDSVAEWNNIHQDSGYRTIYGEYVVKYGTNFVWNLEIIKGEECNVIIGIIPNNEETLMECVSNMNWYQMGGFIWDARSGWIGYENRLNGYSKGMKLKQGDKIQIKFNWEEKSLHYIGNGEDFGNALKDPYIDCKKITKDENVEFRLAVCCGPKSIERSVDFVIRINGEPY